MDRRAVIVIPARYESSRYPGKPLVLLKGAGGKAKPLIERAWEAASRVAGIAQVYVATDDLRIAEAAAGFGADVLMTSPHCRNGTERCAEALEQFAETPDLLINLQGDAPLTPAHFVTSLVDAMANTDGAAMATPALTCTTSHYAQLAAEEAAGRVGGTTAVADANGRALYFSKRLIPHFSASAVEQDVTPVRLHIGVYAYTPAALRSYWEAEPSRLEVLEGLEQLRFLEIGTPVTLVDVAPPEWEMWELNNPSDVEPIERALALMGIE